MLQVKRHSLILEYVVEKGCARVNELSQIFGVSPETIRRDLTSLAKNKKNSSQLWRCDDFRK